MTQELSDLQKSLDQRQLTRNLWAIREVFNERGIEIWEELKKAVEAQTADHDDKKFVVADLGCGSGAAIEEIARNLIRQYPAKDIKALGIDKNVTPELIPKNILGISTDARDDIGRIMGILTPKRQHLKPIAELQNGDITDLSNIPDNSVNFGYSYATLIYVADGLKALEEGYRILAPGGTIYWDICEKDLALKTMQSPSFAEILKATPGASEVFEYRPAPDNQGTVICKKAEGQEFKGFPFELALKIKMPNTIPGKPSSFHRNGIYKQKGTPTAPELLEMFKHVTVKE